MSKILVADDDVGIRNLCYEGFSMAGHEVIVVPRGDQVLETLQQHHDIDLILMDVSIPGEEGLSLLRRMPTEKEKRIPVVLFSGNITAEIEKEAYALGAIDVIQKGIGIKELSDRINHLLSKQDKLRKDSAAQPSKTKILVVDDEEGVRDFLAKFFIRKGYETITARNGNEAIALVETEKPSVVLLDVTMPGMDGVLTLKKIREIDPDVGVVMATGMADEQLAQETAQLGAYAYVLKPFDLKYLELVVLTKLLMA